MSSTRFRLRRLAVGLAVLGLILPTATPAFAWGFSGHRVAAKVAWMRLTPAARAAVKDLLEPGESLADASTWADEHRKEIPESAPWHYINTPITETEHFDMKFCPEAGCVISAIDAQYKKLVDTSLPRAERQKALRFLVHFVEDMHQPVHVGENRDKGGNMVQLQFFGKGTNLHAVWDYGIMEQQTKDEAAWLKDVDAIATPEKTREWAGGWTGKWAEESFLLAKQAYQPPGMTRLLKSGDKLGDDYQAFALPIVRERLAQTGVRLASVLNAAFAATGGK